jgi:hypothetical protein
VPPEGVVNALQKIHDALVPGGLVIDTQPVSAEPPVESVAGPLGALDMREWAQTIATIDLRVEQTMRDGLFDLEQERRFVVTDEYDDGTELVAETSEWAGTRLDDTFAELVRSQPRPVRLHQQITLRLLRAR